MRVQKLTIAAIAVAAGLSLTACGSSDSTAKNDPSASASNSAAATGGSGAAGSTAGGSGTGGSATGGSGSGANASATTGGSGSSGSTTGGSTTGGTGSNSASKSGRCGTDSLAITASDNTIGGDSTRTVVVTLKNKSGKSCTISGFAGVDLKTNSGTISAERSGRPTGAVTLKSGAEVFFPVFYPANDSGGSGVRITGLLVTPPNDTRTVSLAWPGAASLPVTEGGGASVKVGPIGSAGQGS